MHSCDSGTGSNFSDAFGIPTDAQDRTALGFSPGELACTQDNAVYTQQLWQKLLAGQKVQTAIDALATPQYGPEAYDPQTDMVEGHNSIQCQSLADNNMTVAGTVYGGSQGHWFQ